jgi:hypothetical protein
MKQILLVMAALALSACAATPDNQAVRKPSEEKEYRIGSRIPVRDSSSPSASPTATIDPASISNVPARTN